MHCGRTAGSGPQAQTPPGPGRTTRQGRGRGSWGSLPREAGHRCSASARCCHLGMLPGLSFIREQDYRLLCEISCLLDAGFKHKDLKKTLRAEQRPCAGIDSGATTLHLLQVSDPVDQGRHLWAVPEHSSCHLSVHLQKS